MRIVFIGNVLFSKYMLETLISNGKNVVGVFTRKTSNFNSDNFDLGLICKEAGIPFFYIDGNINKEENVHKIRQLNPDIIYCFGFSQIIGKEIIKIPKKGVIGFHPSPLPSNRGRHPIIWSLFLGLNETASTFFTIDENVDSGYILSQEKVPIYYEDNALSLYLRICNVASKQLKELTDSIEKGNFRKVKQNHKFTNYWRKRSFPDEKIDFRMTSYAIYNLVRALYKPYTGASVIYNNKNVKIWKVEEECVYLPNVEPGKILEVDSKSKTILVKAYDKAVRIIEHEFLELPKEGDYFL